MEFDNNLIEMLTRRYEEQLLSDQITKMFVPPRPQNVQSMPAPLPPGFQIIEREEF